jgi:hypothetical protein
MDDQQTYLLNGLLARQFGVGRVVRFREVDRGRQAHCYEIFTAQEKEYLVQLYPPTFAGEVLELAARAVNLLDEHRFSVMPFLKRKPASGAGSGIAPGDDPLFAAAEPQPWSPVAAAFVGEGPQNSLMMVSLAPSGSLLVPGAYTEHDVSQVGLRLGWMHRLLKEQLGSSASPSPLAQRLKKRTESSRQTFPPALLERLFDLLLMPAAQGWVHGDFGPGAMLWDGDHQLRAIVDWGLLHVGAPLEDVVDVFLRLCTDGNGNLLEDRGRALMESYGSLTGIDRTPWTPVVASWCAQRILDTDAGRREPPRGFEGILREPEQLATALAGCVG